MLSRRDGTGGKEKELWARRKLILIYCGRRLPAPDMCDQIVYLTYAHSTVHELCTGYLNHQRRPVQVKTSQSLLATVACWGPKKFPAS